MSTFPAYRPIADFVKGRLKTNSEGVSPTQKVAWLRVADFARHYHALNVRVVAGSKASGRDPALVLQTRIRAHDSPCVGVR